MNLRRSTNGIAFDVPARQAEPVENKTVLDEETFQRMIALERKRSERSRKPFLLMLLELGNSQPSLETGRVLGKILSSVSWATRDTDIAGWYKNNSVVGVMFTEIGIENRGSVLTTMMTRVSETLRKNLTFEQFNRISISFHMFPEEWGNETPRQVGNSTLYPDLSKREEDRKFYRVMKRVMDVVGSSLALLAFAPLFAAIAVAIKLNSKGPVFYRQQRIGQFGVPFVFLKFRSMYMGNDASVHKEYVTKLINGKAEKKGSNGNGDGVYKLTDDSRITWVGKILRRTSMDELPQFFNVLRGEMSLVGPRPAIQYEVEAYDIWHRSRLFEAKPGITGLWQVNGRSRVEFDDMVRLDLMYARTWSPWMDVKILMRTPRAVVMGEGAY